MLKLERYFKSGVGLIAIQQFAEEKLARALSSSKAEQFHASIAVRRMN
ncbi:MAG: hypothetical protein VCD50_04270 [Alphaproteobacteria bacterium]|jgi:hypothetical protein